MSLRKHLLNQWLRWTEKPHLARAEPDKIRKVFEQKARLLFHPPRGTEYGTRDLIHASQTVASQTVNIGRKGPLLLYFHGGAYVFGSPKTHRAMLARISALTGYPVILPRYRLAPENPFPAASEDALTAYRAVMDWPGGVILGGDSAGGGLALGLLGEVTRQSLRQPIGSFFFSPLTDMTFASESFRANASAEVILPAARAAKMGELYLAGADPNDPRASPIRGEFAGAGPVWFTAGDTEILLDDTRRMVSHLEAEGVSVTCTIERDLPHVWPIFHGMLPEATQTLRALSHWLTSLSPRPDGS